MIPEELLDRLLDFCTQTGRIADALSAAPFEQQIARELVRSTTAAGPSYEEALVAERRHVFTSQLDEALRELRRARYWLRLIDRAELLPEVDLAALQEESSELCRIMEQSIASARTRAWQEGQFGQWRAGDLQFTIFGFQFATFAMGFRREAPGVGAGGAVESTKG